MFTNAPVVTDVAVVVTVLSVLTVGVVNVVKVVVLSVTQQTHAGKVVRCTATIAIERKSLESNLKQIVVIFVIAILIVNILTSVKVFQILPRERSATMKRLSMPQAR